MLSATFLFTLLFIECAAQDYYYNPSNATRVTLSGIAAYRSSLTLDWLAAEDSRQRELAAAFETEPALRTISADCIAYPRPAPGKIGRLMLEVLKKLNITCLAEKENIVRKPACLRVKGDEGNLVSELIQVLVRTKILVETSILETEPDLDSLVKIPGMMMGEPHTTFPRVLAVVWMMVTDPAANRKHGWCSIHKVTNKNTPPTPFHTVLPPPAHYEKVRQVHRHSKMNQYLRQSKPHEIAQQMRTLDLVVARARFIMEEFIQNVTPLDMYRKKPPRRNVKLPHPEEAAAPQVHAIKQRANEKPIHFPSQLGYTHLTSMSQESEPGFEMVDGSHIFVTNYGCAASTNWKFFVPFVFLVP